VKPERDRESEKRERRRLRRILRWLRALPQVLATWLRRMASWYVPRVDRLIGAVGRGVPWLLFVLVLVGVYNVVTRKMGRQLGVDLSSNLYIELQWYCFSALFLLGASSTLKDGGHVQVDAFSQRLSPSTRHRIQRLGTWLLLIPFCVFVLSFSLDPMLESIRQREQSPDPGGLPRYLLKPLIPLGFLLLLLQAIAEGVRPIAPEEEAR